MTAETQKLTKAEAKPFFSLKWKILLLILILFTAASSTMSYISYSRGIQIFQTQLSESIRNNATALLTQSRQNLIDIATIIATLSKQATSGSSELALANYLSQNWDIMSLEWDLESLILLEAGSYKLQVWGQDVNINIDQLVKSQGSGKSNPKTEIICNPNCSIYAVVPMYFISGEKRYLILGQGMTDFVMSFANKNHLKAALLRISDAENAKEDDHTWFTNIIGMTERDAYLPVIKQAAQKKTFNDLQYTGDFLTMPSGESYYIYATPILADSVTGDFLVLASDITLERDVLYQSMVRVIAISLVALIGMIVLIFYVLHDPMRRIQRQANLLPLLAQKKFLQVRKITAERRPRRLIQNELDVLEDTAITLSIELEQLMAQNEERAMALEHMALYDALTGLANRRMFTDELKALTHEGAQQTLTKTSAHAKASEAASTRFSVVFIDLDDFKRINDTLGHDVGDELLIEVSSRLRRLVRDTDIVARLGGDEFTLILKPLTQPQEAEAILGNILEHFQTPILLNGSDYKVSMSIGAAIGPDHGQTADDLMRCADMAMYKSKKNGKNCFFFFTDEMNDAMQNTLRFERELYDAVNSKEFKLYYQPIIDLQSGKVVALEALLRWCHPTKGIISADQFIDQLENNGQIFALGAQVFELACLGKRYLNNAGFSHLRLSLNMSSKQFTDPMLIDKLDSVLSFYKLLPRDFQIELNEQTVMTTASKQSTQLKILQEKGFNIAIDEFGTGHSSLAYLRELPLDLLKIHRSFLKGIPTERKSTEIVSAVAAMANKLDIKIIATGIEQPGQEVFIKEIGCEFGQGDYYYPPQPLEDLILDLKTSAFNPDTPK